MTAKTLILIVEDESIVALDIQNRLKQLGYLVPAFVASGEEAIAKSAELRPDLILMDIKLKGEMDGIEAAGQIKAQLGIPSIYLTAFADDATLQRAKETEPLGYLIKPFEERELLATIRMALNRLQIERQLRESEQKFRSIIQEAMDGIFLIDPEGCVIEWNPAQAEMTGVSQEDVLGRPAWDIWHYILPDEQKLKLPVTYLEKRIKRILKSGELPDHWHMAETEIQRPDGELRVLESRIFLFSKEEGGMAGSICRDITESKKLDEMMRQAQKIESLGILAGGAAHDFNNLLVVMLGQTSLALAKLPTAHPAASHIKKAVKAAEDASKLTQQMLAISGQGQLEKKLVHFNRLIEEQYDLLKVAVPDHITLELDLTDVPVCIMADRIQLQQVLTNLVINAAEAIGQNEGVIQISTAVQCITDEDIETRRYFGSPLSVGKYVRVTVSDNGTGMDSKTLTKVFDPFFSTKKMGRGLGLSAVAGIVRGHQGAIWVDSTPRDGTIFSLLFPENCASGIAEEPKDEGSSKRMTNPKSLLATHVLVIDDQETVCEAVKDILTLEDIPVMMAYSGQAGVDIYEKRHEEIGLVLLDLSMPGMNGYETYQLLRQIDPAAPVIFSSGYDENEILQRFAGAGLVGFLKKPYNLSTLLQTVKQHMGL